MSNTSSRGRGRGGVRGRGGANTSGRSKATSSAPVHPPQILEEFKDYLVVHGNKSTARVLTSEWPSFRAHKAQIVAKQAEEDARKAKIIEDDEMKQQHQQPPSHEMQTRSKETESEKKQQQSDATVHDGVVTEENGDDNLAIKKIIRKLKSNFHHLDTLFATTKINAECQKMIHMELCTTLSAPHPYYQGALWVSILPPLEDKIKVCCETLTEKIPQQTTIILDEFEKLFIWMDEQLGDATTVTSDGTIVPPSPPLISSTHNNNIHNDNEIDQTNNDDGVEEEDDFNLPPNQLPSFKNQDTAN